MTLCVYPYHFGYRPVAVGKVCPFGKALLFPKGIALIVAGKYHKSGFVDAKLLKSLHSGIYKSCANAMIAIVGVNGCVIDIASPPVIPCKDNACYPVVFGYKARSGFLSRNRLIPSRESSEVLSPIPLQDSHRA